MPVISSNIGEGVVITHPDLVNLYGCSIGPETRIGPFVEIQKGVRIGARCKVSSHSFICEGVTIEDEVFVGHGVMFTNGLLPRATNEDGTSSATATGNARRRWCAVARPSGPTRRSSAG